MKNWKQVPDETVRHVWVADKRCNTDECDTNEAHVDPTFYQDNGTPCCQCGMDMIYSHSEVAESDGEFSITWDKEDVIQRAYLDDIEITEDQALEVVSKMEDGHDCNDGMNWGIVDIYIDEVIKTHKTA